MWKVTHSRTIDGPREAVFSAIGAIDDQPQWNPSVRSVRRIDRGSTRFVIDVRGVGRSPVVISELHAPTRLRLESPHGALTYRLTAEGQRTRVDQLLELQLDGWRALLAPVISWIARRRLRAAARALAAHLAAVRARRYSREMVALPEVG
jgi:uncharacterized protein YndB with AHSA1/START domain